MTEERIQAIGKALAADDAERKALLEMTPEEAAKALAAKGYDFTAEELGEFGKLVADALPDGELDADSLENVAGGSVTIAILLGATFGTKVAYDIGKAIGGKWW